MKPAPFDFLAPNSLSSALEIMDQHGYDAKLLAGGQSLIPAMNFRLIQPMLLVDLNRITELDFIRETDDGGISIGSLTRQRRLERDAIIERVAPLLHETIPYIAHPQIRNRGTIGGTLAHADPAAELPVIMVALDGRFRLKGISGERWVAARDFFEGIFTTSLAPEEILVEVVIPPMKPGTGWSFIEFSRRKGDYALLGVAALLRVDEAGICQEAKLVYLNAGEIPIVAREASSRLVGAKPSPAIFEQVAAYAAEKEISPTGDIHASVPYLRHLARVLTIRALNSALRRVS